MTSLGGGRSWERGRDKGTEPWVIGTRRKEAGERDVQGWSVKSGTHLPAIAQALDWYPPVARGIPLRSLLVTHLSAQGVEGAGPLGIGVGSDRELPS